MVKTCQKCGGVFRNLSNSQKYCSAECLEHGSRDYYQRKFQSFEHECRWCGYKFLGTAKAKWCSEKCKEQYQKKERKRRKKEYNDKIKYAYDTICKKCGRSFKGNSVQMYCSEVCRCEAMRKFDREQAIRLFEQGKNIREIARELGAGATTIRRALKQRGFDTSKNYIGIKKKV